MEARESLAAGDWIAVSEHDSTRDLGAFLATVERRALRIAEIATRNRDDALDVVQDAMLQLARSYARRPAPEWPPLFYRILENKIRDWQRRRAVKSRLFLWRAADTDDERDPIALYPDPAPSAGERLQRGEALQRLEQALRELPTRQREAFELRLWEGLSVEDTARAMGCSGGSVKTHLSRALTALRAELEGVWP